ncbi:cytochrome P450 9e2-like [Temnothorax longispinosus]|uniref:cytochrome P450 9e2-like n=1 Tax=Temnothorax longispinosus TaxID=300112 RepID=UPI003A9A2B13
MIHLLMQARDKEGAGVHKMTLDDIVSQAAMFFFAGFDTSSTLMCFAVHELTVNQGVQDRLRKEVQQHLAEGNGEISYESLSKMSYMDMVISETLRMYPPTILTDRLCAKRYELPPSRPGCKNFTSRSGVNFPNPDKFNPERFSEENKDKILPYTYLPFGYGPRKCIGNRFVLMETKILIVHFLQKFTLKTTENNTNQRKPQKRTVDLHRNSMQQYAINLLLYYKPSKCYQLYVVELPLYPHYVTENVLLNVTF